LNQILRRQTSRSHYGSKVPAVTVTVFKYRNKIGKIVVKAVPYKGPLPLNHYDEISKWNKSLIKY
jgi:hypothetical protein